MFTRRQLELLYVHARSTGERLEPEIETQIADDEGLAYVYVLNVLKPGIRPYPIGEYLRKLARSYSSNA